MADVPAWHAKGEWFDVCRCNVPCPCSWAQSPDDDYCDGVLVWHIREGRYGNVALDGLNVVAFASFKGNLWEGAHSEPKMGVVMDERADEGQREALQMIFGGQAGGWPARLNEIFGPEMLGLEFAPIEVEIAPGQTSWRVVIPGLVRAAATALSGPTSEGKPPRMENLPGSETGPGILASTSPSIGAVPTRHDHPYAGVDIKITTEVTEEAGHFRIWLQAATPSRCLAGRCRPEFSRQDRRCSLASGSGCSTRTATSSSCKADCMRRISCRKILGSSRGSWAK